MFNFLIDEETNDKSKLEGMVLPLHLSQLQTFVLRLSFRFLFGDYHSRNVQFEFLWYYLSFGSHLCFFRESGVCLGYFTAVEI